MATRQYIGARYVPKFYDFNGSSEWREGTAYEALTIVTRNGNSYTSKIPVPASVGAPESNTEYWVSTGIYNQQIESYRALVDELAETVDEFMADGGIGTNNLADGSVTDDKIAGGTITTDKLSNSAKLEVLKDYVTPQMFGGVGDGITDDTTAIQSAFDSGKPVLFPKGNYKSGTVTITNSNTVIEGCGSEINFGRNSGIVIDLGVHDVVIEDLRLVCEYVKDSQDPSISCLSIAGSTGEKYFCYNITVRNCYFTGAVTCIGASSVKHFVADNCEFYNYIYTPENSAGGYGILLQSCVDVSITNCEFNPGRYGRHDIYVSVDRRKTTYTMCENVYISKCNFDHSELTLDTSGFYYSSSTVPINVRTSKGVCVNESYFYQTVGIVTFIAEDGNIYGSHVTKCLLDTPVLNSGTSETKMAINLVPGAFHIQTDVYGVVVLNAGSYGQFCMCSNCDINIHSCYIDATRIHVGNNVTINVSDVITTLTYYFIRLVGTDTVKGSCRNITFANGTVGDKINLDGSASVEPGFLECGYYTREYTNATYCYRPTNFVRQGETVVMNVGVLQNLPSRQYVTLFTVEQKYRPKNQIVTFIPVQSSTPYFIKLLFETTGEVKVYNNSENTGSYDCALTLSYIGQEWW